MFLRTLNYVIRPWSRLLKLGVYSIIEEKSVSATYELAGINCLCKKPTERHTSPLLTFTDCTQEIKLNTSEYI